MAIKLFIKINSIFYERSNKTSLRHFYIHRSLSRISFPFLRKFKLILKFKSVFKLKKKQKFISDFKFQFRFLFNSKFNSWERISHDIL